MTGRGGEGAHIVLVDGLGELSRRLEGPLAAADFDVTTVDAARDCLRLVEGGGVDGVVSEHELPDLGGLRLLRSIRLSRPGLPFVLVPYEGSESLAGDAVAAGVSAYVPNDGDPATVVARLRDSLERRGAREGGEVRERYRHLVEISPAPINVFDETGESIWGNRAVLDLLGLERRDQLVGRSIFEFIHPDDHDIASGEVEDVTDRKESVGPTPMRLLPPDGEVRHILVSSAIGSFLGTDVGQAVVVDVTELYETERELRDARQFIENALDVLEDLFYVVDGSGQLLRWNERLLETTGYTADELEGERIDALFDEADGDRIMESVRKVVAEGSDAVEAKLRTRDGRKIHHQFRGRRLRDDDGVKVVGIGRDVSERKERVRQLKVLETWLRHNIRNDMSVISGIAESIAQGQVGDVAANARRIRAFADRLVKQADRERELVEMLTTPPEPVTLDVAELVRRRARALRERYPSAEIELTVDDGFAARAIPKLADAVDELVGNAVEHNDAERPSVRIEVARRDEDTGVVRIADDGPGIPEVERETLHLDREIDPLNHGSGLGMLFVYWILRLSNAEISFAENEPRGSVVTLALRTVSDDGAPGTVRNGGSSG